MLNHVLIYRFFVGDGKYKIELGGMIRMSIAKKGIENTAGTCGFEEAGKIFAEDEKYALSRYKATEQDLYLKAWKETFENSPVLKDERFKKKAWENVLSDTTKLQLKIIDKLFQEYVGEVILMHLDTKTPELGIQLLRKYQGQGIGTRVMKLFVDKLKTVLQIEYFSLRICSDNYISQRMAEKLGAVKVGEEGKEHAELMRKLMQDMGREKFENTIQESFEKTQRYTICYKLFA